MVPSVAGMPRVLVVERLSVTRSLTRKGGYKNIYWPNVTLTFGVNYAVIPMPAAMIYWWRTDGVGRVNAGWVSTR